MIQFYRNMAGIFAGLAVAIAFNWAIEIKEDRDKRAVEQSNEQSRVAKVMAAWRKFEEQRP